MSHGDHPDARRGRDDHGRGTGGELRGVGRRGGEEEEQLGQQHARQHDPARPEARRQRDDAEHEHDQDGAPRGTRQSDRHAVRTWASTTAKAIGSSGRALFAISGLSSR